MKFLSSQLAYLMSEREMRANLRALLKYILTLIGLILTYAVLFHVIKTSVEGEQHSWITGLYWTLVVMTTLGFGDITFTSDIGRLFSILVLLSGVVLGGLAIAASVVLPLRRRMTRIERQRAPTTPSTGT